MPKRDDRAHVLAKIVAAGAGSVGTRYAFARYRRVPWPDTLLPAFRPLGLWRSAGA